ncbi:MAG TPA: hypothetical protein PLV92_25470, partial [Pirellulaceae bacterium]|nr:hypothetical protein [Pirellulaceae bacterium]
AVSPTIEPVSTKRRVIEVPVLFAESPQVGPNTVDGRATKGSAWDSLLNDLASIGDAANATDAALASLWDD